MRERVLSTVRAESIGHTTRRRWWPLVAVAASPAAVVLAGIAIGLTGRLSAAEQVGAVLASPDARVAVVEESPMGAARFVYSDRLDRGVFAGSDMPPVAGDEAYQLWIIDADGPSPAEVFRPGGDGSAVVIVEGPLAPGVVLGLTVEPEGGSEQPTGEVLLAQELG